MGTWSVKLQKMKDVIEEEYTFSGQLEGWSEEIDGIRRGIDFHGAGRERVISCLLALSSKASEEGSKMQKLGDRLNEISNAYRISEDKIYYNVLTQNLPDWIPDNVLDMLEWAGVAAGSAWAAFDFLQMNVKQEVKLFTVDASEGLDKLKDMVEDKVNDRFEDEGFRKSWGEKGYLDREGVLHEGKPDLGPDDIATGKVWEVSEEAEVSILSEEWESSGENWNAKSAVKIGKAGISGSAYAGLFTIDENGQAHFAPSVGVEMGAAITAFEATGEATIGNDVWGAYTKGEVKALSAELEAEMTAGLYDENNNFNPQLNAGVSAETVLVEAGGTIGGTIAGVGLAASGSVGVGAGAHADIGYKDGVLSFDVGAYVGVGASVEFEIDVGSIAEASIEVAVDAGDMIADAAQAVWDFLW